MSPSPEWLVSLQGKEIGTHGDPLRTQGEGGCLQDRAAGLRRNPRHPRPRFRRLARGTLRSKSCAAEAAWPAWGTLPRQLRQINVSVCFDSQFKVKQSKNSLYIWLRKNRLHKLFIWALFIIGNIKAWMPMVRIRGPHHWYEIMCRLYTQRLRIFFINIHISAHQYLDCVTSRSICSPPRFKFWCHHLISCTISKFEPHPISKMGTYIIRLW